MVWDWRDRKDAVPLALREAALAKETERVFLAVAR
jgi:hypothetical protein